MFKRKKLNLKIRNDLMKHKKKKNNKQLAPNTNNYDITKV